VSNRAPTESDDTASSELIGLLPSWRRHPTAQRMSSETVDPYSSSVRGLDRFLASAGLRRRPRDSAASTSRRSSWGR
jgi:hypothetical protein